MRQEAGEIQPVNVCYLLHDRDTKFTCSFRAIIESGHVKTLVLPAHSPNLNGYAERWVRSVKEQFLSKAVLFGERSLRRALNEYVAHYHVKRNHQGKGKVLLFPRDSEARREELVQCSERLGGLAAGKSLISKPTEFDSLPIPKSARL